MQWNSDAEVERARDYTNSLAGPSGAIPILCPEPKEKPPAKPSMKKQMPRKHLINPFIEDHSTSFSNVERARDYTNSLAGPSGAIPILCPEPKEKPPAKPSMKKQMPRKHLINPFIEDHSTSFSNVERARDYTNSLAGPSGAIPILCPEPKEKPPAKPSMKKQMPRKHLINPFIEDHSTSFSNVERARDYTNSLAGPSGAIPILCPEPKEKPPAKPSMKKQMPRKHLINPFIEDHSTSFSNVERARDYTNSLAGPSGAIPNIMNQMNNFTGLNLESINNLNALNLNPSIANTSVLSIYNPNVWAVPKTPPILITTFMAPDLLNQTQPTINVAYNRPMRMSQGGTFATDCVENSNNSRTGSHLSEQGNARKTLRFNSRFITNNKYKNNKYRVNKPSNRFYNQNDLRQRIGWKRSKTVSITKPPITWDLNKNAKTTEVDSNGHNEEPIMNRRYAQTHEESSKLDLGPLTFLAPPGVNPDWFVVVDLNVLLTEFKFLNKLTDSDDKCHLLIPAMVMAQLQEYVIYSTDVPAHRILRFLSQQIEIGYAFMAEDPNLKDASNAKVMFKSCMEQANRNYFVVLISNDEETLYFKDLSNVTIYSVTEIKRLLNGPFITQTSSITKENPISLMNDDVSACGTELCNNEDLNKQNEMSTADAGIQTYFEYIDRSTNDKKSTNENFKDVSTCSVDKESSVIASMPAKENTFVKKGEINLKFSVSNKQQVVDSGEKKHLTWPWSRNTNPVSNNLTKHCAVKIDQHTKLTSPVKSPITTPSGDFKKKCMKRGGRTIRFIGAEKIGNDNNCMESTSGLLISRNFTQASENSLCNLSGPTINNIATKKLKSPLHNIKTVSPAKKICITNTKDKEIGNIFSQLKISCDETTDAEKFPSYPIGMKQPSSTKNVLFDQLKATKTVNVCTTENDNTKRVRRMFGTLDSVDKPNRNLNESVSSSLPSVDILVRSTPGDNITVEKASTSGIISNSESNVHVCDYTFSNQHESGNDSDYEQNMYHIDNDEMGEHLAIKCDEWVSRYRQIMEEVLTLVLLLDPLFSHKTLTPPWSLQEATQCIQIKFIDHPIVRRGANRLSSILFDLSDAKGKISMDMSPYQYMKMYSAGVYLLACLKAVINNSDDIQIAVESLKLLLNDIKNPAQDNKCDELNETPQEIFVENETEIKENDQNSEEQLRSDKSEHTREEVEEPVKLVRKKVKPDLSGKADVKFRYMMHFFLTEVEEALSQVKTLCDRCYAELKRPHQSKKHKYELKQKAEKAQLQLKKLCGSLDNMLEHGTRNADNTMREWLKKLDLDMGHVSNELLSEYRTAVAACKQCAADHADAIEEIITELKECPRIK